MKGKDRAISKRVAMICVHSCPLAPLGWRDSGGMNVYVRELSRELGRRGIFVDIFTSLKDPSIPTIVEFTPKVRVIHIKLGDSRAYHKNSLWRFLPEFLYQVDSFTKRQNLSYSIIHSHYWLSGWVAKQLKDRWNVPMIHMFHTLGYMKNRVARDVTELEPQNRIHVEKEIMESADGIVAATPLGKDQMVYYGAEDSKIEVIPGGVDLTLFKQTPVDKTSLPLPAKQLVLFVGRIDPIKGIDYLIEAMFLLAKDSKIQRKDLSLLILGGSPNNHGKEDEERKRLKGLVNQLGIEDLVAFLSAQDQSSLPHFYSAADVCVLPSLYESFGLVVLEAMACGTPVIASNVGGLPFAVEEGRTGFLVPPRDPSSLAEKIKLVLKDYKLRSQLSIEAKERVKEFTWSNVANQTMALYEKLGVSVQPSAISGQQNKEKQQLKTLKPSQ